MAHRRRALSRWECVVACGIAATLVGLLLPTIQKLRAASDRTRCANQLRGLGTGILSYHQTKRRMPPGGSQPRSESSAGLSAECRESEWSWAYHLLPFIGHADAYGNPDADTVRATVIPAFSCPARRDPRLFNNRMMLDYAANAGTRPNGEDGAIPRSTEMRISLADFTDGAASTVLLAEKRLNIAEFGNAPGDMHGFATPGWTDACEAHRFGLLPPAADVNVPGERTPFSEFGSSHRDVFNALFADGTVRTIRFTVSPAVWQRACVRNDHQFFNFNDL